MTLPIACTLDAESLANRQDQLLPGLVHLAAARSAMPEGLRLTFAASTEALAAISRALEAERNCCPFLRFQLTVEAGQGPLILEITGPPGTSAFLEQLLP